jgi:PKD repeat protein
MTYSVSPSEAGTIDASTGVMNWDAGFTGAATITATASGLCGSTSATRVVTVNPKAYISAMTASICSGETFTLTPANGVNGVVPPGTTYSWNAPAGAGFSGGSAGTGELNISGTLTNTTGTTQIATYTITPLTGSCQGNTFILSVTIQPKPSINPININVCSGVSFNVAPLAGIDGIVPSGTKYTWGVPVVTGGVTGGAAETVASANITNTLVNPGNTPQIAMYTVTPVSGSCTGTPFNLFVTVNPVAKINPMTFTVCSGVAFNLSPVNITNGIVPAGTTYSWSEPAGTGFLGGASGSGEFSVNGLLTNTTSITQTATYSVTPVSGGCTGTPFNVEIVLEPRPSVTAMTATITSGSAFNIVPIDGINGTVPAGTSYSWATPAGTGFSGGFSGSASASVNGTLVNSTSSPVTAVYTVTPSYGGCPGSPFTVTVSIKPSATISPFILTICSGESFTIIPVDGTDGIIPAGTTYSWDAPDGTGFSGGIAGTGAANISATLTNSTNSIATATYTVTPKSGGITGVPFTIIVTVNPKPAVNPIIISVCSGSPFSISPVNGLNGIIPAGTTYSWLAPTGSGFTGGSDGNGSVISGTLANSSDIPAVATYTVTPVSGTCTGIPFTITINVLPVPVVTAMNATICSGESFSVTPLNGLNGTIPSGTTYSWTAPSGSGFDGGMAGSGLTITGTLTNKTSSVKTATYSVTPVSGGCTGTPFNVTVTINPLPVVNNLTTTICSGGTFVIAPADIINGVIPLGTTYTWSLSGTSGSISEGAGLTGPSAVISGSLVNSSNVVQTATYTAIPVSGSCTGDPFSVTVTVNPIASINPVSADVCSGTPFSLTPVNITDGVVPSGTTYSWSAPSGPGFNNGTPGIGSPSITGVLNNTTSLPVVVTYSVTPSSGSCTGTPFNAEVTVRPSPVIAPIIIHACSGSSFNITPIDIINGIVPTGTTYSWSAPAGPGISGSDASSGASSITGTLINNTSTVQTVIYNVTPIAGGCSGPVFRVTVILDPKPQVNDISYTICSGTPFSVTPADGINGTVPAGTTYSWSVPAGVGFSGGSAAIGSIDISGTLYNSTSSLKTAVYTVTPVTGGCTGTPFSVTININPKPAVTIISDVICSGGTFSISPSDGTNGIVPSGTTYTWLSPALSGGITGSGASMGTSASVSGTLSNPTGVVQTATYTVVPVAGSCTGVPFTVVISVKPVPTIISDPVSTEICENTRTSFNINVAGGSDISYQWFVNKNDGSGFQPIVMSDASYFGSNTSKLIIPGALKSMNNYVYHAVISDCLLSDVSSDAVLTVNSNPEIILQPRDSVICTGGNASFTADATGNGITYKWQRFNGTVFQDIPVGGSFSGMNTRTLQISSAPVSLNNNMFRVVIKGSCGDPIYSNYVFLRLNTAPFVTSHPANKVICEGAGTVTFSSSASGNIDSLRWQVLTGGTWTDVHDNINYSGSGSLQLTVNNIPLMLNGKSFRLAYKAKCTTIYSNEATLTVNSNPVVDFGAISPLKACGGVPIVLNGNPSGGSGTYTMHTWSGDIGPLNNTGVKSPVFNTKAAGSYDLNYRVKDSNGCYANGDLTIVVDSPSADFVKSAQAGCTPLVVSFTKDMTGVVKFWWNFGDGSPVDSLNANPVHIFRNSDPASIKYYDVTLRVESAGGCRDTYTSPVTVYPESNAVFTVSQDSICSGGSLTFTSMPGASKYFWDYGDGDSGYSLSETTNHIFTNFTTAPVMRIIRLITTSFYNCTDTMQKNIVVMPMPTPQFTATPLSQIYNPAGNQVSFTNQTNAGAWNWMWKFGDRTTAVSKDPVHNYSGIGEFSVILISSNEFCADSVKHNVTVRPIPPVALFDSVASGCAPLNIVINNTSQNIDAPGTTYHWNFGDGSISTAKNPTYTYFDAGTYRIELTVTGPGGTSTISRVVNAYPSPRASLQVNPNYVFANDEPVRYFNLSQGADSYLWEFGDGDTSKVKEPSHKYMEEGVYDITLWAFSNNGCSDKDILSPGVTVDPAGDLRFSTAFRPNLDGPIDMDHLPTGPEADQFFYPPVREKVHDYKLQIFNRWGVLIFECHDINKPWNGYYKNELCQQGVYVWYVEGKYANGKPFKKAGDITLLH